MRRFICFFCICASCFFNMATGAELWADLHARLDHSKAELNRTQSRWEQAQSLLHTVEQSQAKAAKLLKKTKQAIANNRFALYTVKKRLLRNKASLAKQVALLNQSLRAMSQWVNQPPLKWVFTGDDPSQWSRMARYQRYIGEAQTQRLTELKKTRQLIVADKNRLILINQQLLDQKKKRLSALLSLKKWQAKRSALANHLRLSLKEQKRALQVIQAQLDRALKRASSGYHVSAHGFSDLKHHLVWPLKGRLLPLFGQPMAGSDLRWQGVLLRAPQDYSVRAVAPGRVVYADWLSGFGWLLIIDHGGGYMSLYGRNHYLIKQVGEWVKQGTLIARVGKSGGFERSALYFSIRHNAQPLDPAQWLSKRFVSAIKKGKIIAKSTS